MAVSLDGYTPVIGLAAPPVLAQKTMPLRPLPAARAGGQARRESAVDDELGAGAPPPR